MRNILLHLLGPMSSSASPWTTTRPTSSPSSGDWPTAWNPETDDTDRVLLGIREKVEQLFDGHLPGIGGIDFYYPPLRTPGTPIRPSGRSGEGSNRSTRCEYKKQVVYFGPPGTQDLRGSSPRRAVHPPRGHAPLDAGLLLRARGPGQGAPGASKSSAGSFIPPTATRTSSPASGWWTTRRSRAGAPAPAHRPRSRKPGRTAPTPAAAVGPHPRRDQPSRPLAPAGRGVLSAR